MNDRGKPRPPPPEDCPLERYLNVVSGAWVPRILWYLRLGARRYGDLRRDLKSISGKVLTVIAMAATPDDEREFGVEGGGKRSRNFLAARPRKLT
ncbi:winged helix-turn-helix transcriptional regulator [Aromatoleum anaerobium]|uniref:HTH hxlR-type domain-containing protein n=1 Tax=Aromatoleum anaerobium TaxID=182180 RepID=A0ABX1PQT6_9RHOO|nr:winged helix-turn-helix transcriptional regulator [Aromatoleum anaerobium]MCK0505301.1 winged helix-turn-helix transcriptional regulator [Aromatoleum anaerobium]